MRDCPLLVRRGRHSNRIILFPRPVGIVQARRGASTSSRQLSTFMNVAVWLLSASTLCSLATSFTPCSGITERSCARASTSTSHGKSRPLLRARGQDGQGEVREAAGLEVSEFKETSSPVKAIVAGLTDLFVRISGEQPPQVDASPKPALSVAELEDGIRGEYAKNYLWTGDINEGLYEDDCSFTDPTLSFSGLDTYRQNIASLQGLLDKFVTRSRSELFSCELRQQDCCVRTRWRMVGDLRLPWGPTIDVIGRTTFTYDPDRGNRIWSYDEVWEVQPAEALLQIFRPERREEGSKNA